MEIKGTKFQLANGLAGLLLLILFSFPVWVPLILLVNDLMKENNAITNWFAGGVVDLKAVFLTILHYLVMFIPALIILALFKSSKEETLKEIKLNPLFSFGKDANSDLSWKSIGISGSSINNRKWVQIKPGLMAFKSTYPYRVFTYPVIGGGIIFSFIHSYIVYDLSSFFLNYGFMVSFIAILMNLLFYFLSFSLMISLNKNVIGIGGNHIGIKDAEGIQVLCKQQSHSSGGKVYNVYETNLIYGNGKRYNFLNHGDLYETFLQISQVNEILKTNVILDEKTKVDIDIHNKEVLLQET